MTLEDSIHASRVRVLREAERSGNVSATCRRHGVSRTVFYRLRRRFEQYGADGVHPKRRRAAVGRPSSLSVQTERRIIAFALAWPTSGPQWLSDQLARDGQFIAPVTVWRLLRRHQLGTRRARLAVLEQFSAATQGILTERTAPAPFSRAPLGIGFGRRVVLIQYQYRENRISHRPFRHPAAAGAFVCREATPHPSFRLAFA